MVGRVVGLLHHVFAVALVPGAIVVATNLAPPVVYELPAAPADPKHSQTCVVCHYLQTASAPKGRAAEPRHEPGRGVISLARSNFQRKDGSTEERLGTMSRPTDQQFGTRSSCAILISHPQKRELDAFECE